MMFEARSSHWALTHFAALVAVVFKQTLLGEALSNGRQFVVPCLITSKNTFCCTKRGKITKNLRKKKKRIDDMIPVARTSQIRASKRTLSLFFKMLFARTRKMLLPTYHHLHIGSSRLGTGLASWLLTGRHDRSQRVVRLQNHLPVTSVHATCRYSSIAFRPVILWRTIQNTRIQSTSAMPTDWSRS